MFSNKQKVYTTSSTTNSINNEVNIIGKKYPSNLLGRLIANYPRTFLTLLLIPLIFCCFNIVLEFEYSLNSFQLSDTHRAVKSEQIIDDSMNKWILQITGVNKLSTLVNDTLPNSNIRDRIELRVSVNSNALRTYLIKTHNNISSKNNIYNPNSENESLNLLSSSNIHSIHEVEQLLQSIEQYKGICFKNNLEYGILQDITNTCAPVSSLTQYYFPIYNNNERKWHMNGNGSIEQVNMLPRIFANSNYRWFTDIYTTYHYPYSKYLRSQLTFASTPTFSQRVERRAYRLIFKRYINSAVKLISTFTHPYLNFNINGPSVENVLTEIEMEREIYKIPLSMFICWICTWIHTSSFSIGMYIAILIPIIHFAATGTIIFIFGILPPIILPSIVWISSFVIHATLNYYDTFIISGVMPTSGRRNNLSVEQRVSFTMRRSTSSVIISNIIAIIILAISMSSIFKAFQVYSVFLIIELVINIFLIVFITPSFVMLHHLVLSNKRRNLQKQTDIINKNIKNNTKCNESIIPILREIQEQIPLDEWKYENHNNKENSKSHSFKKKVKKQFKEVTSNVVWETKQEITAAVHKARKRREEIKRKNNNSNNNNNNNEEEEEIELPDFCADDFMEVGPTNPLGILQNKTLGQPSKHIYFNPRMLHQTDIIHIPLHLTQRSIECWTSMQSAMINETSSTLPPTSPPNVKPLLEDLNNEYNLNDTWYDFWKSVFNKLNITSKSSNDIRIPLVTRAIIKSQNPSWVIGGNSNISNNNNNNNNTIGGENKVIFPIPGSGNTGNISSDERGGWGIKKFRYRWKHRKEHARKYFWGMFGKRRNETSEEHDTRLMQRKVKREGFTAVERLIQDFITPAIYKIRWFLLLGFILLFIISCVLGSRLKPGILPITLRIDNKPTLEYHAMDNVFGQQGICEFCGPYYTPIENFRTANEIDLQICESQGFTNQMHLFIDYCGICNGTNDCIDCAGVINGNHKLLSCGRCVTNETNSNICSCQNQRNCPYCEWALNISGMGGKNCSVPCNKETCGNYGHCDSYTGKCICDNNNFTGVHCEECRPGLLPREINPNCTLECNIEYNSLNCLCNLSTGRCTNCPPGTLGVNCDNFEKICEHGYFNINLQKCICNEGYTGELCELSLNCSQRGQWLSNLISPFKKESCGCRGHWRGPTCQLCDCLNGGMCDINSGKCNCVGGFTGERCESCAGSCMNNGNCVENVNLKYWNVRTCIPEFCDEVYNAAEEVCAACKLNNISNNNNNNNNNNSMMIISYCNSYEEQSCKLDPECWWDKISLTCIPARNYNISEVDIALSCKCNFPNVWNGVKCDNCLVSSEGSECSINGNFIGCNGFQYNNSENVIINDECGVCGGDGFCRGCDGIPNSGLIIDICGVCGGDNSSCNNNNNNNNNIKNNANPIQVLFFLDLKKLGDNLSDKNWSGAVIQLCNEIRKNWPLNFKCFLNDYLNYIGLDYVPSLQSIYDYASSNKRFGEIGFTIKNGIPVNLDFLILKAKLNLITDASIGDIYSAYLQTEIFLTSFKGLFHDSKINIWESSSSWIPSITNIHLKNTIYFFAVVGIIITIAIVHIYFISIIIALGVSLSTGCVFFSTLVVCIIMSWQLDSILLISIIPTIPIAVEYLIHLVSGYFDYLHATTSNLFARDVTRKVAFKRAIVQTLPPILTSCFTSILIAISFNVSKVLICVRIGQIVITVHILILLVVLLFSGVLCVMGPLQSFRHWSLSLVLFIMWAIFLSILLLSIYKLFFEEN